MATAPQQARIASVERLMENIARVRMGWEPGQGFPFRAGQWTILQARDGDRVLKRCFSIASPPHKATGLTYIVERTGTGGLSDWLHAARGGEAVEVRGPHGRFVVEEPVEAPLLFIAFDTGISPIWSILQDLAKRQVAGRFHLEYGWSHDAGDPPLHGEISVMAQAFPDLTYETRAAGEVPARLPGLLRELPGAKAYLAGRVRFLDPSREALLAAGLAPDRILEEPYDRAKAPAG